MRTCFSGGSVLTDTGLIPDTSLIVEGDRIQAVGASADRALAVDAHGLLVLPGIIDLHADAIERALEPRSGVAVPMPVALAEHDAWLRTSGITTCFVSLTDGYEPGVRSRGRVREVIEGIEAHGQMLGSRHPVHIRREICAEGAADEVAAWIDHDRIGLLSWGDHLPRQGDPDSERRVRASLARRLNGHAGDLDRMLAEARARSESGQRDRGRLSALARAHGLAVASHDDASPAEAEASAIGGATICEFPADLATAHRARELGLAVLMGAPNAVRGASHLGWMSAEAAVRSAACDALCSDYHHPCLLHAPFALAQRGACDLATAWRLVSTGPARAAGLADRGRLAPGQLADLVLIEPGPVPRVRSVWVGGREIARFTGSSSAVARSAACP